LVDLGVEGLALGASPAAHQGIAFAFDAGVKESTRLLFRLVLDDVRKETCLRFTEVPVEDPRPEDGSQSWGGALSKRGLRCATCA